MNYRFIAILACLLLAGCLRTRAEIEADEGGAQMQRQTVNQQVAQAHQTQAAPAPAPVPASMRFDQIDDQFRTLNGRVDSVESAIAQMNAGKKTDADNVDKEKQAIEQRFVAYEEALKKQEAEIAALNDQIAQLKAAPPAPAVEKKSAATSKEKDPFATGEHLFGQKKWKDAIVEYSKYRDKNPKGKHYAEATYKIGVSFQELGMKDEARSFLEEVVAKSPKSKEGKKAALRLKSAK